MCVKNWLKIPQPFGKMSENCRGDFLTHTVYSAIHVGSRWKIQARRQIKNTDN